MKRRKFLKLITYSPFMFLIPSVLVGKRPPLTKANIHVRFTHAETVYRNSGGIEIYAYHPDGAYVIPEHIACKIIKSVL